MIQTDDTKSVEAWYALPSDRAEKLLEKWLHGRGVSDPATKAKLWLKDLRRCHLLQDAKAPGEIELHHQLFQEYYAAEYLLRLFSKLSDEQLKREYLNLLKWTEPIALMLALVDDEKQALRVVKLALNVDFLLGARLVGKVKRRFQQQFLEIMKTLKIPNQWRIRFLKLPREIEAPVWFNIKLLKETRSEHAVADLCKFTRHPSSNVRKLAIQALVNICSETDILKLIEILKSFDPYIRSEAVDALGNINSELAIENLCGLLLNDPSKGVRSSSAQSLEKIGCEKAKYALRKALTDPEGSVRHSALSALAKVDPQMTILELIKSLYKPDKYLCDGAVSALLQIDPEVVIPAVVESINNSQSNTSKMAIEVLNRIASETATSSLQKLLDQPNLSIETKSSIVASLFSRGVIVPDLLLSYEPRFLGVVENDKLNTDFEFPKSVFNNNNSEDIISNLIGNRWHERLDISNELINSLITFNKACLNILIPVLLDLLDSEDRPIQEGAYDVLRSINTDEAIIGYFYALVHNLTFPAKSSSS